MIVSHHKPVVVEQDFNSSKEELWKAITKIGQMRKWYFDNIPDFKAEVGFETEFNVQSGSRDFRHQWNVTEVVPKEKIVYDWKYAGYEGDLTVSFELFGHDGQVKLRLTAIGIESFPQDIPEFKRESCKAGWEYFIKESLTDYLNHNNTNEQ